VLDVPDDEGIAFVLMVLLVDVNKRSQSQDRARSEEKA
jgi:hypothetical protein